VEKVQEISDTQTGEQNIPYVPGGFSAIFVEGTFSRKGDQIIEGAERKGPKANQPVERFLLLQSHK